VIESGSVVERAVIDKRVHIGKNVRIGGGVHHPDILITLVGKGATLPDGLVVEPGAEIGTDVVEADFENLLVKTGQVIQAKLRPYDN
jgi:acetyltransferase-like isoleucine patch superfamily enzyme